MPGVLSNTALIFAMTLMMAPGAAAATLDHTLNDLGVHEPSHAALGELQQNSTFMNKLKADLAQLNDASLTSNAQSHCSRNTTLWGYFDNGVWSAGKWSRDIPVGLMGRSK